MVPFPCVSGALKLQGAIRDRGDERGGGRRPSRLGVTGHRWFRGRLVSGVRAVTAPGGLGTAFPRAG